MPAWAEPEHEVPLTPGRKGTLDKTDKSLQLTKTMTKVEKVDPADKFLSSIALVKDNPLIKTIECEQSEMLETDFLQDRGNIMI